MSANPNMLMEYKMMKNILQKEIDHEFYVLNDIY